MIHYRILRATMSLMLGREKWTESENYLPFSPTASPGTLAHNLVIEDWSQNLVN